MSEGKGIIGYGLGEPTEIDKKGKKIINTMMILNLTVYTKSI